MNVDDWIKNARAESNNTLLAKVELTPGASDTLRLTPYLTRVACQCSAHLDVPRKFVTSIEPTTEWCVCDGVPGRVWLVQFLNHTDFPVDKFLAVARGAAPAPGPRLHKPGTYFDRVMGAKARPDGVSLTGARKYPGNFDESDVLFESELGFVLTSTEERKCEESAAWRQSVVCGTVFLGSSRIEIDSNGSDINVGITGLCINCSSVHTLSSTTNLTFDAWFFGTRIVVYNSFVSWDGRYDPNARVTMHH